MDEHLAKESLTSAGRARDRAGGIIVSSDWSSLQDVEVEQSGSIWTLRINRPEKRNALRAVTMREICGVVRAAEDDATCRTLVFEGAGSTAFSAGADVTDFADVASYDDALSRYRAFAELSTTLRSFSKPTIGIVRGLALGGGLALALLLDLVVADPEARFGVPEVKVGLFPMIVLPLLVRVAGQRKVMEMCLTGRLLSAQEAAEAGLITRVAPAEEIDAVVARWTGSVVALNPATLALARQAVITASEVGYEEGMTLGRFAGAAIMATPAAQTTIKGFVDQA